MQIITKKVIFVPFPNPYVTDGLVAMWDSEWNAGAGIHDSTATTWVDISGNGYNLPCKANAWIEGGYDLSKPCTQAFADAGNILTCELVVNSTYFDNGQTLFKFANCNQRIALNRWNDSGTMYLIVSRRSQPLPVFPTYGVCPRKWTLTFNDAAPYYIRSARFDGVEAPISTYTEYKVDSDSCAIGHATQRGTIQTVRLYNRVLSEAEIAANHEVDAARFGLTD